MWASTERNTGNSRWMTRRRSFVATKMISDFPLSFCQQEGGMHLPSEQQNEEGLSRRGLVQALAVGAAASVATPSFAQPAKPSAIVAEATSADYVRDPTRWGSPEVAALFPGFKHVDMRTK